MKYQVFEAPPDLKPFVRFFWALESEIFPGSSYTHRSMADGCPEMIFHYRGTFVELTEGQDIPQSFSLIHAQSRNYRRFITYEGFGIFGAYLYPFAVRLLFTIPASELSSQMVDLYSLLGPAGKELEEKIMTASGHEDRVCILSSFLRRLAGRNNDIHRHVPLIHSIREVIHSRAHLSVDQMAMKYNLSVRQFERKFKECAGFSPKLFSRIVRFHHACNEYGNKQKTLTEIALDCGYYDQAHFIHDFREFSGYHPKEFFKGHAEGTQYREA